MTTISHTVQPSVSIFMHVHMAQEASQETVEKSGSWGAHLTDRSSRLLAGDSGKMGNTIRFGQTSRLVRVSLRNGSSHSFTRLADAPPPNALPKLRLKWIRGGLLLRSETFVSIFLGLAFSVVTEHSD